MSAVPGSKIRSEVSETETKSERNSGCDRGGDGNGETARGGPSEQHPYRPGTAQGSARERAMTIKTVRGCVIRRGTVARREFVYSTKCQSCVQVKYVGIKRGEKAGKGGAGCESRSREVARTILAG